MLAIVPACLDIGRDPVEIPLSLAGTAPTGPIAGRDGASIELHRARLAFGPLWLCAGTQAGELCDTALLEWLDSAQIDVLRAEPRHVGTATGVTGIARSWMADLGITSLLTQDDPLVLGGAQSLDGASVELAGTAIVDDLALDFRISVPIQQEKPTEIGVPVLRSAPGQLPAHSLGPDESGLLVRFDPGRWVDDIDFDALVDEGICVPDEPCEPSPDGQAGHSVRARVIAGTHPTLEWGHAPQGEQ
jgi:hypothetical protein